jgi:Protein of unknown function (DUF2863)
MRTHRSSVRAPRSQNAESLIRLVRSMGESGSRVEDEFWAPQLTHEIERQLAQGSDASISAALDFLFADDILAYELLADHVEGVVESMQIEIDGKPHDVLLIACPLFAWTRASIAAGKLPPALQDAVRAQLHGHVLAKDARVAVVDALFSPDQLPNGYAATRKLLLRAAKLLAAGQTTVPKPEDFPQAVDFMADSRFVLAVVAAPVGTPLFAWQEAGVKRADCIDAWKKQGAGALAGMLANCAFEMAAPAAFFHAVRSAEQEIRPFSIKASVSFLHMVLDLAPAAQRAVIARCVDREFEEYRIGFTKLDEDEVLHGCLWPLLGAEIENPDIADVIEAALREAGVTTIVQITQQLPAEFCPDCGAPHYPNAEAELLHAELPLEDEDHGTPQHLH